MGASLLTLRVRGEWGALRPLALLVRVMLTILLFGCSTTGPTPPDERTVPHEERWGIYALELATGDVELIASSPEEYLLLRLNNAGDRFAFSQKIDGEADEDEEICTLGVSGTDFRRLTQNDVRDIYPAWSPDDSRIAFLSWRHRDLDIYVMDAEGGDADSLYDSGAHDADIDWSGDRIAFTTGSTIWSIRDDGTDPLQITDPPNAGEWGSANLPFGDYDPRYSPDGTQIAFERLVDDASPHGNYDIYVIDEWGFGETALTSNGYTQGFPSWSHSGDRIVYAVAVADDEPQFDICMMNADGTSKQNITPDYFPDTFLCNYPQFSLDDSRVFFVGEWWEE